MVNLPRGQKVSGLHGVPSLFQGAILRLVRLNGLSLQVRLETSDQFLGCHAQRFGKGQHPMADLP